MSPQTTASEAAPVFDLGAENSIGGWEWAFIAFVVAIALIYLLRKFTSGKTACAGCGAEGCCGAAEIVAQDRPGAGLSDKSPEPGKAGNVI